MQTGQLTEHELTELTHAFRAVDDDGSGGVDTGELYAMLRIVAPAVRIEQVDALVRATKSTLTADDHITQAATGRRNFHQLNIDRNKDSVLRKAHAASAQATDRAQQATRAAADLASHAQEKALEAAGDLASHAQEKALEAAAVAQTTATDLASQAQEKALGAAAVAQTAATDLASQAQEKALEAAAAAQAAATDLASQAQEKALEAAAAAQNAAQHVQRRVPGDVEGGSALSESLSRDFASHDSQAWTGGQLWSQDISNINMDEEEAATKIQAMHRGNRARCDQSMQHSAATGIQRVYRGNQGRVQACRREHTARSEKRAQHAAATRIQSTYRGNLGRIEAHTARELREHLDAVAWEEAKRSETELLFYEFVGAVTSAGMEDLVQMEWHKLVEQIIDYRRAFDVADLHGSNAVNFSELTVAIKSLHPDTTHSNSELENLWETVTCFARTGSISVDDSVSACKHSKAAPVRVQYGSSRTARTGGFEEAFLQLDEQNLVFRERSSVAPGAGRVLRTSSVAGCTVSLPKQKRKGALGPTFKLYLAERDSAGDEKYIIEVATEDDRTHWMNNIIRIWDIELDFTQFLHGMAAARDSIRGKDWLSLLVVTSQSWTLLPLIIDMPSGANEVLEMIESLSRVEKIGLRMLQRHKASMDLATIGPVIEKAVSGRLSHVEPAQVARLRYLWVSVVTLSGLIGLILAGMAASVENILCFELGINGVSDAYWVCTVHSQRSEEANASAAIVSTSTMDPDQLLCTSVHVIASSCVDSFLSTVSVLEPAEIPPGSGFYPPGSTGRTMLRGLDAIQRSEWATIDTDGNGTLGTATTMKQVCSACECVVCGCADHPSTHLEEISEQNKLLTFWAVLIPVLILTTVAELALLGYCAMRYSTRVAWALDMRLVPLNPDRLFVANTLVRAAFELGNPNNALMGVDPAANEVDDSKTLFSVMLFKSKVLITGLLFKFIVTYTCSIEFAFWMKPWLGMVLAVVLWDTFTASTIMTQATIRGFGVYTAVELFDEIIDQSYTSSKSISSLARVQIARAVGVAIVVHGVMHPSMELLLRNAMQRLELLGMELATSPGTLDSREGFLENLAPRDENKRLPGRTSGFQGYLDRKSTSSWVNPMLLSTLSVDEQGAAAGEPTADMQSLPRRSFKRREQSFDHAARIGVGLEEEDQVAVLSIHLLAFMLDGSLDGVELKLWKLVCEAVRTHTQSAL